MLDLEELRRLTDLALESHVELQRGQLSPGAFDSRWSDFHRAANPQTVLALLDRIRELEQEAERLSDELHGLDSD
jgi:hypothetical protein